MSPSEKKEALGRIFGNWALEEVLSWTLLHSLKTGILRELDKAYEQGREEGRRAESKIDKPADTEHIYASRKQRENTGR